MSEPIAISEDAVLNALSAVEIPQIGGDPVTRRYIREIKICDGNVAFEVALPPAAEPLRGRLEAACREAVGALAGVTLVNIRPSRPGAPAPPRAAAPAPPAAPAPQSALVLPGVAHIIAVGSGKGGVGKSTVAVNLAVALAESGARVGLLDADVYGPSVPQMMGATGEPAGAQGGKLLPLERHGVKLMSLGFLMPPDATHVIWRGPMVASAIKQMLTDCLWGNLDYLLVDLPPGTGDAQLTLAQSVPLTGAVVVMTSQDVAVNIASKAVGMFRALKVPILGVVGNMDSFACPHCGEQTPIFTRGGSEAAAVRLGVPFLGAIPLDPSTVEHGDEGTPTLLAAPNSVVAESFRQVARAMVEQVSGTGSRDPLGGLAQRFRSA